eukprot:1521451-Rhodomonas_salina.1
MPWSKTKGEVVLTEGEVVLSAICFVLKQYYLATGREVLTSSQGLYQCHDVVPRSPGMLKRVSA